MKVLQILLTVFGLFSLIQLNAQSDFNTCAAIFSGEKMLVGDYSPGQQCRLSKGATTMLSLNEVILNSNTDVAKKKAIPFKVAIKDHKTNTLILWDDRSYTEISASEILKHCQPGDLIVMLTLSRTHALPHPDILVTE